jgi:membrane protease YdiL (CAAX protease family)
MLPMRQWKAESVLRLLLSVLVCMYGGSLLTSAVQFLRAGGKPGSLFFVLVVAALGLMVGALSVMRRPWMLENFMRRLITLLVCFYGALWLGYWAQTMTGKTQPGTTQMVVSGLSFQGAALLLTARFLREHESGFVNAFGFLYRWKEAFLWGVIVACLFLPVGMLLQHWSYLIMQHWVKPQEQQAVETLRTVGLGWHRIVLAAVTIMLAPAGEETLFRGVLYPWIKQAGFPGLALWSTALIFALMHLNAGIFLPLLCLALVLTLLYEKTGNLLAPITAHALFNAMNFVMLYLQETHE